MEDHFGQTQNRTPVRRATTKPWVASMRSQPPTPIQYRILSRRLFDGHPICFAAESQPESDQERAESTDQRAGPQARPGIKHLRKAHPPAVIVAHPQKISTDQRDPLRADRKGWLANSFNAARPPLSFATTPGNGSQGCKREQPHKPPSFDQPIKTTR